MQSIPTLRENALSILKTLSDPDLRTFIEQHTTESLYYDQMWLEMLTKLYGYTINPLTTKNSANEITGFLPLCSIQSTLTGKHLVSLPFSDYCPLLTTDNTASRNLIDQAIYIARQQKVKYLELRTGSNDILARHPDFVEGNLYVRWLLSLNADPDVILSKLRKPIQRQIMKSQNLGVTVRIAEKREDITHYYHLHLFTRSKKYGMPSQSLQYFFYLWDIFAKKGKMKLLLAEYEGKVIAGMILLASGSTVRYAYGASNERFLQLAPNNLLMWNAISWSCVQGYQTLDLGRTACANEGLMEYKRRWGAIKVDLPYYYFPQTSGLASTSENNWKYLLFTNYWRKLPLAITAPLGGYLYKHLG